MSIEMPEDANIHAEFCTKEPSSFKEDLISSIVCLSFFKVLFSPAMLKKATIVPVCYIKIRLPSNLLMFLKFIAKKILSVSIILLGTSLFAQAQFSPNEIPGLELWLAGDSGITLTGDLVSQWNDMSSNQRHATSWAASIQPSVIPGDLNGHQVVSFDGVYDFVAFPEVSNCRTIFWVVRENPAATGTPLRPLLGYTGGVYFLRGENRKFWYNGSSHPGVYNGVTRLNFEEINGTTTEVPQGYFLLSLQTSENVPATHVTMEAEAYGRTWWGEFAELIIFSSVLSSEEVLTVENYLAAKYGPAAAQIPDVTVPYGFCDTLICAPENFNSYQWSTGEESSCIEVNEPGQYYVTMSDYFGRTIRDTVFVSFPGNLQIPDTSRVCFGEEFYWNTGLNTQDYELTWSNDIHTSDFTTSTAGEYSLSILDTNECTTTRNFVVAIDSFATQLSLGNDLNLCSGNTIALQPHSFENITYLWNTGATSSSIPITNSGSYSLIATDQYNCLFYDTIQVTVIGTAPALDFDVSGLCEDASSSFHANTNESLSSIVWFFGDGQSASGIDIEHTYINPGDFIVQLNATANSGCSASFIDTIHVFEKPSVTFTNGVACNNEPVTFSDVSTSSEGIITEWNWLIDDVFYNTSSVTTTITSGGFQTVLLEVIDSRGCSSEISAIVDILHAPTMAFEVTGVCEGSLTTFNENIVTNLSGNINLYVWNFGDNTGSILQNPSHYYAQSGEYVVTLNATASNGCSNSIADTIVVFSKPNADYEISNACVNSAYTFQDVSHANPLDPIIQWHWIVDEEFTLTGAAPQFVFNESGLTPVTLQITSEHGCTDFISQQIPVWNQPAAAFSYSPEIGPAPFDVQFINETENIAQAHWIFGDTHESDELNPMHTYTLNSTYYARLIAINQAGCTDTAAHYILVDVPEYDIALQTIEVTPTENGNRIIARITNTGNITITQLILSWQVGNDAPVLEEWNGELLPETTMDYEFHSLMQNVGQQYQYICVVADPSPIQFTEVNKTDNEICQPISNTGLEVFPPYPNPGDDRMFIRFITPLEGDLAVKIFDVNGKLAMELNDVSVPKGFHQYFIDISGLAVGSYRLSLEMESLKGVVSFMKIHRE
jgi:PKD repeat protein